MRDLVCRACSILILLAPGLPSGVRAEGVAALSALKSAYTLHFLNLTRWDNPAPSLDLCVLGDSQTDDRMYTLHDKPIHGQTIRVRRISPDSARPERCDALYLSDAYQERSAAVLALYDKSATLTISDIPNFVGAGGVIGLLVVEGRLRFDVNERVATKKGLHISAKLLELAREVRR